MASQQASSTKQSSSRVVVTKVGGMSLESSRDNNYVEDDLDAEYIALAQRSSYSFTDLISACYRFGNVDSSNSNNSRSTQLEHNVLYRGLRDRADAFSKDMVQAFRKKGLASEHRRDHEAQEWQAKAEKLKLRCMAANLEAADCLFVQKNPDLARRVISSTNDSSELKIDLHMLHVAEARDITFAVLALASMRGWKTLRIITGKGIHSSTGGPKILPEIEALLKRSKSSYVQSYTSGNGYFLVKTKTPGTSTIGSFREFVE
jgi:DNA-nicking Smr family endonuclease